MDSIDILYYANAHNMPNLAIVAHAHGLGIVSKNAVVEALRDAVGDMSTECEMWRETAKNAINGHRCGVVSLRTSRNLVRSAHVERAKLQPTIKEAKRLQGATPCPAADPHQLNLNI